LFSWFLWPCNHRLTLGSQNFEVLGLGTRKTRDT
jgi:hypothetical protein